MNRYLNSHPAHIEFLDQTRTSVGFRVNFFAMNLEDVDAVPGTAATCTPRASHFASCKEMAKRLDAVFPEIYSSMFYALPLSRKQIICAVLSGLSDVPGDTDTFRNNLCLCSERYLLRVRFGAYDAPLHRFLETTAPRCLLMEQYDPLWVLSAERKIKLESYSRGGTLDTAGIIARLPTRIGKI